MATGMDFRQALIGAVLALGAVGAPAAALAQDSRYVPGYEPGYVPASYGQASAFSLLGAYNVAQIASADSDRAGAKPAQPAGPDAVMADATPSTAAPLGDAGVSVDADRAPQASAAAFVQTPARSQSPTR